MAVEQYGRFELETCEPGFKDPIRPNTTENTYRILIQNLKFAKDKVGDLYVYLDGVYSPVKDDLFVCCAELYKANNIRWTSNKFRELDIYLTRNSPELLEKPLDDRINLRNGIYYIEDDRFESHEIDHSDYLTTTQIPIDFNPDASCPQIARFMEDIFPEGPELLFDIIGICMTPVTGQAKAVILLGSGSNGKSIYLYGLRSAVGLTNCSTVPMHTLADKMDKFSTSNLVGVLVNAADDMSQGKILDTANVKSIISGNPIRVEGKYKKGTTYIPFCKLVFGANHRLSSDDETTGYLRRMMHIPFEKTFSSNPSKEAELKKAFSDPVELSGLFNEIRKRLRTTVRDGFIIPDMARDKIDNYTPISSEDENMLKEMLVEDITGKVPIYNFHVMLCVEGYSGNQNILKGHIKYLFPNARIGRPRYEGKQMLSFIGIKVRENTMEYQVMNNVIDEEISYLDKDL